MIKLKELLNSQGEETKFEKGMAVKDINPDCPHKNSVGVVTKVDKDDVTYTVMNVGETYTTGDELTKSKDQLVQLSQHPFADDWEEAPIQPMKEGILKEGRAGDFATIYNMKEEMKEGKFDPKNPTINIHGWGVISLEGLENWIKRDLTKLAKNIGGELAARRMEYELYTKHSPLEAKVKGLWEVYQQMNSSQYKRAVTIYKRKKR
tara:strand:- start:297 stop:914 length:618 start_codon:yes stop_codon:yes gene_type:complete